HRIDMHIVSPAPTASGLSPFASQFFEEVGRMSPFRQRSRRSTPIGVGPLSVMKKVYTEPPCNVMLLRVSTAAAVEVLVMSNWRSLPPGTSTISETWPTGVPSSSGEKSIDRVSGAPSVDMPLRSRSFVLPLEDGKRLSSTIRLVCGPSALLHTSSV